MSYMESAMQDQIDGSIAFQNQICDDACDVYKKTHLMASDLLKQRAELLEALKMVQEAAIDMRGEDFNLTTEQWSIFHAAIANAEK